VVADDNNAPGLHDIEVLFGVSDLDGNSAASVQLGSATLTIRVYD